MDNASVPIGRWFDLTQRLAGTAGLVGLATLAAAVACTGRSDRGCYQGDRIDESLPAPFVRPISGAPGSPEVVVSWVDYAETESCYVLLERWATTADPRFTRVHVLPADTTEWKTSTEAWKDAFIVEFEVYAATGDARSPSGTMTHERPIAD